MLTSIDAPGAARGLLSVLPELTRKHKVVVASVTDPEILRAAAARGSREEVYRAAAAERALLDAARVATAIRQSGAEVVTAAARRPPARPRRPLPRAEGLWSVVVKRGGLPPGRAGRASLRWRV